MKKKVKLNIGKGYLKDSSGKIIEKFDLPPGEHEFPDGVEVVEVKDDVEFEKIQVKPNKPPNVVDYKTQFQNATTLEEKINIIAQMLGLV